MNSMPNSKEKQLRNHKNLATGLFFLMALIYALMVYLQHIKPASWMGFVEAFSEAGMVGALADWFAVTALFRHPLGLPIPHTNLIERKQKDLGENLGKFVKDNFLNPENIRPYIEKLDVVTFVSNWLIKKNNQEIVEEEVLEMIKKVIDDLDDKEVENFLTHKAVEILHSIDYQKLASSGIHYVIEKEEHVKLLERILPQLSEYVEESRDLIRQRISENRPFIAFLAGKKISTEVTDGLLAFIEEIQNDKNHFVRQKLTLNLEELAKDLLIDSTWNEKFDALKLEFISEENLSPYTEEAWVSMKQILIENLEDSESLLKGYLRRNIQKLAFNLTNDEDLGKRINNWIQHFLYRMVLKNRNEVERLISNTVESWEGKDLSNKLELEVGKDLQYIRINGTLVGGLVGLVIYSLTHFVFWV